MTLKNYFSEFFRKKRFIAIVVLSILFTSFLVFDARYGFLSKLKAHVSSPLGVLCVITAVFFSLVFLFFTVFRQNEKETCFIYSLSFSLILTGVVNLIFLLIINRFTLLRLAFDFAVCAVGALLLFIKTASARKNLTLKGENKLASYLRAVTDLHTFLFLLLVAVVSFFSFSLIIRGQHPYGFNAASYILLGLVAAALITFTAFSLKRKDLTVFDDLLVGALLSSPIVFANVLLMLKNDRSLALYIEIWAAVFMLVIIALIFRVKRFGETKGDATLTKGYLREAEKKYGISSLIFTGALFGVMTMILFRYSAHSYYFGANGASFYAIPYVLLNLFVFCSLVYGEIYALVTVKRKEVGSGDAYLLIALSYTVFALLSMIAHFTLYGTIILVAAAIFSIVLICLRMKFTKDIER